MSEAVTTRQSDPSVVVQGLTRRFGAQTILDGIDLTIGTGEFVVMVGRSGSGKSTMIRTLAGLDPFEGRQLRLPPSRAIVFQDARLLPWRSVWRNVALGLTGSDLKARCCDVLREVGLAHRANAWPLTLSGGEAQRAALARALIREPGLLLLDEPFASLDALTRQHLHSLILALWHKHRPAIFMVTHDLDEAVSLADRIIVLAGGGIVLDKVVTAPRGDREAVRRSLQAEILDSLGT